MKTCLAGKEPPFEGLRLAESPETAAGGPGAACRVARLVVGRWQAMQVMHVDVGELALYVEVRQLQGWLAVQTSTYLGVTETGFDPKKPRRL